ncbi:MAG TPA: tetratricopeptide repeat protein [Candidatus Obscuribacterales bacterium]
MEHTEQTANDSVILKGQLSADLNITRVLKMVCDHPDVEHGVLKIKHPSGVGFIAIHNGSEISGALTQPEENSGVQALQEVFRMEQGEYVFRRLPKPPDNLDQSMELSIEKLFGQMNKVLVETAIKEGRTPSLSWIVDDAFTPSDVWNTQQLRQKEINKALFTATSPPALLEPSATQQQPADEGGKSSRKLVVPAMILAAIAAVIFIGVQIFGITSGKMRLQQGIQALKIGTPDLAAKEFTAALEVDPGSNSSYLYRAIAYSRLNQPDKAIADYTAVLDRDSSNTEALLGRACQYLKTKDFDKAKLDCDTTLKADDRCDDAYRIRAVAEAKQGNYDPAVSDSREYLRRVGDSGKRAERADVYAVLAMARLKDDQFGAAIDDYSKAIELDSHSSSLYAGRAAAFKTAGDWKNATADCDRAIKLGAGWDVYELRATAEQAAGNLERAAQDLSAAVKQAPGNLQLYQQRAEVETLIHHYDQAAGDYHYLLEHSPGDAEVAARYAFVRAKLAGPGKQIRADVTEPADRGADPHQYVGDSLTLTKKGYQLIKQGLYSEAVLALSGAVHGDPNNNQARLYLCHAFLLSGNFQAAAGQFAMLSKVKPLSVDDKISYAHALEMSGQSRQATSLYEQCLATDGTKKEVRLSLIDLYSRAGAREKAERAAADGIERSTLPADRHLFESKLKEIREKPKDSKMGDDQA